MDQDHPVNSLAHAPSAPAQAGSDERLLDQLQRDSYGFFLHHVDRRTGLVRDRSTSDSPLSIAATGMALACYPVAVDRGLLTRSDAAQLAGAALRFMLDAPHGPQLDATGHQGFYYHFLDPVTGRRAGDCELSTIDSALLIAGGLMAAEYFTGDQSIERAIREAAAEMLARVDWHWALAGGETICHGWRPESGFIPHRWEGYAEALILYVLALGSPTHAIAAEHYRAWTRSYVWKTAYDLEYLYAGPLFIHQLSHCWIDFRGLRDEPMRAHDSDYFENSRRATLVQQRYAIENPLGFRGYSADAWGITACEGPGPTNATIDGVERTFFGYKARGVPFGPDDGTLAPWAVIASLPFAPEVVLPTIRRFDAPQLHRRGAHGFPTTFNPTFPGGTVGWTSIWHCGLNQGPVVLMLDNFRHGLPWRLMRGCRPVVNGLRRAGFSGGWLEGLVQP